jgi:hypothetical protein
LALDPWRSFYSQWAGRAVNKLPRHLAKIARRYQVAGSTEDAETLLLAMQTYYAVLVQLVGGCVAGSNAGDLLPGNPFSWYLATPSTAVEELIGHLGEALASYVIAPAPAERSDCDLFKAFYQDLFPRALRHALGEYYTPDWLAEHVLDQVGYTGDPDQRLLDPSCGSGTFLLLALRRLRAAGHPRSASLPIVGLDINPLAVMTARANYRIALADLLPEVAQADVPVYLCDSIQDTAPTPSARNEPAPAGFDYVVGNPPWIAWDNLATADRQATKALWQRYGLFSLSGNAARHGGGKKDLSMLMLYATADRYLKLGGRLGMVITQTVFQSQGAGDGFRRFRIGPAGALLGVFRVDDMVALRPFGDAANWTSTIMLRKGEATRYPVPYFRWENSADPVLHGCLARPSDATRPTSPWMVLPVEEPTTTPAATGAAHSPRSSSALPCYTARLGANSGGANGVYWVELLGRESEKTLARPVQIRNRAGCGKRSVERVESWVEPDLLYPLLRWSDLSRWSAVPRGHILLAQDTVTRTGIPEAIMLARYPRTLAYLEQFHTILADRAAYRRYQHGGPFYAMYNVGPYTVAPTKVVWRRMDRRINAAVVEEIDDPRLGRRPIVPQETCVLVACDTVDEAHYLCAVLNSSVAGARVAACSVRGGKGFGTPGMLDFLPLARFQPKNPRHAELAGLSRRAHAAKNVAPRSDEDIQEAIDPLVERLFAGY